MAKILPSSRFDTLRGGTKKRISFSQFVERTKNTDSPPFVVEGLVFPDLGESSWGGFIIREGAAKVLPRFRR